MTVTTKRSDATRQALLQAARAEFAEHGLSGARVDRIAEAAGVNKERIYGLFGSKDKLFDVIVVDTMREFIDVVQPLAESDPGEYVGKLFDYHRANPQLLRLLQWEALHRGAEAHDVNGWRAAHYERKFDYAQQTFADEPDPRLVLLALCGLANWTHAVPQVTRLLLGAAAEDTNATRDFMKRFARSALGHAAAERPRHVVNRLTGEQMTATEPPPAEDNDPVDRAAARLRAAQAAAETAREELAAALRAAHAEGAGANQLARQVAGTLSRPVVLKLLAD
ncbi:TetR/AcrR family transcriptional regulator [Nocardia xishanensis]|uniref:TetR/AcrR family transcriptional regulator n=1 Tax=Nocardia xishanensis TaxID=238964 RepID=UPI000836E2FC|nr:TetR family transcriptional regulator [Nocardia xishanensis]